ncbi:unnamed protein product [Peronospora farinosa]|uniref:SWIM-type domain-containing protein n=1 Tax=Peronospora farinosa TaxID=134698 RepID=A0AAV0URM9_9STRA|nr:unnamed protein product [Peronospora farinosa]CAI5737319.1 unnamed protein product [Peronospora farinosa]
MEDSQNWASSYHEPHVLLRSSTEIVHEKDDTKGKPLIPTRALPLASQFNRLDKADLEEAIKLGLLLEDLPVNHDTSVPDFGVAYEKKGGNRMAGCGIDVFRSQRLLQERCKQFAMQRGFQLYVSGSSTRPNGGGNVKYRCKKLHGQQFFDSSTPVHQLQCPFYINGYGKNQHWKITRACFLHNHYKFIGCRTGGASILKPNLIQAPIPPATTCITPDNQEIPKTVSSPAIVMLQRQENEARAAEETECAITILPQRVKAQRNTTMSMKTLCRMVTDEVNKYPISNLVMAKLDGKIIRRILLRQGHTINHMMSSRIKRHLQEERVAKVRTSFQKLHGYLKVVAEKNPGSHFRFEKRDDGAFQRALFIPNATLHAVQYCRKIVSLDHITHSEELPETALGKLEGDGNDDVICGVYLKASIKDFNDEVITLALALVNQENELTWEWFLRELQSTQVTDWNQYTVIAGRAHGLQTAIQTVWPQASYHSCMRRVVEDEVMVIKKVPMTSEKKQSIFDLARSDSKSEFDTLHTALVRTNEAAVAYLDELDRKNWVKYAFLEAFQRPTFNELTSDLSMALGSDELFSQHASTSHIKWFGEDPVCSSQPLDTYSQYFTKIADNFHERRQSVKHRPAHELVPRREEQLQQILQGSQRCESVPCANGLYMVRYLGATRLNIPDSWRHVNLDRWECTCQDWQDQHFPCLHAIHAAELDRRRIDSLYDTKQNSIENYLKCYATLFTPWPVDASPIQPDVSMKTPLDFFFSQDGSGRRKPGPRPKNRKASIASMLSR